MFCSNCGSKILDNSKFCSNCGNNVQKAEKNIKISTETKLAPAKCTSCGANINVNPNNEIATCPYCNNNYVVEKAINMFNVTSGNFNIEKATINVIMGADNINSKKNDCLPKPEN